MNNKINYFDWRKFSEIVKNMSENIKKDYNPEVFHPYMHHPFP